MMPVAETPDGLLDKLTTYTPPSVEKWIEEIRRT
jgi:hypothetical protein